MEKLDEKQADYAEYGNVVHNHLAEWFLEGRTSPVHPDHLETFNKCKRMAQNAIDQWSSGRNYTILCVEKRFWSEKWGDKGQYQYSGKPDIVAVTESGDILILDFKTLYGEQVESPRNLQLRGLATLLANHIEAGSRATISVGIIQPMVSNSVPLTVYPEESLAQAKAHVRKIVEDAIDSPPTNRSAGVKQCQYCPFKDHCQQYHSWVRSEMTIELRNLPLPTEWTPSQWRIFLDKEKAARDWLADMKEIARTMLENDPDSVEGYTLSRGRETKTVTDPKAASESLSDVLGRNQFMECCKPSLPELIKSVAAATQCKLDDAELFVMGRLTEAKCVEVKEGAKTIKKKKDK